MPEAVSVELIRIKNLHRSWGASKILQICKKQSSRRICPGKKYS